MAPPQILVAGIGNIFLGDDGFGVEVARRLMARDLPDDVLVVDFGIRGFDLALALTNGYDAAIVVDTVQRGGAAGTLYVIEPELPNEALAVDEALPAHDMVLVKALGLARGLGTPPDWVRIVGCEPSTFGSDEQPASGLSPEVAAAVSGAVEMVERLVEKRRARAAALAEGS
jgi:hydrogenase maturation protease